MTESKYDNNAFLIVKDALAPLLQKNKSIHIISKKKQKNSPHYTLSAYPDHVLLRLETGHTTTFHKLDYEKQEHQVNGREVYNPDLLESFFSILHTLSVDFSERNADLYVDEK